MNPSAVTILRRATSPQHALLEDRLARLGGPLDDLASYRSLLEGFWGFYEPFEPRLDAWHADHPDIVDWPDRRKRHLLDRDLADLGRATDGRHLPRCEALPDVSTTPAALGALYVLEGSTLGGRVVTERVGRTLGLADRGCRFFASYGPDVPRRWQAMRRAIDQERDTAAMAESANATFRVLTAWLT